MVRVLTIPAFFLALLLLLPAMTFCGEFTLASYNVENLFDARIDGTEYPDYVPGGPSGWNAAMAAVKTQNLARVIKALEADIVCLQEIESAQALQKLTAVLKSAGIPYPFTALAANTPATVKCAVISRFPIIDTVEISTGKNLRPILQVTVMIDEQPLLLLVNHWRSKQRPESHRLQAARALQKKLQSLPADTDFILAGDFNANYNEHETILSTPRLNDTEGITGINHILGTIHKRQMVTESMVRRSKGVACLYNLWLELPAYRRWSHNFYGRKSSLDHLLLPPALYDSQGISYVDNSFEKFDPDFLFHQRAVYRWQRTRNGQGRHLGRGFSDHLPIRARFITAPFTPLPPATRNLRESEKPLAGTPPAIKPISALYNMPAGRVNIRLENCVVIYTHQNNAVIKQPGERAIFIYKAARKLQCGKRYHLTVQELKNFHGLREITRLTEVVCLGAAENISRLYLSGPDRNLSAPRLQNEVLGRIKGLYKNRRLHYGHQRTVRLYFKAPGLRPPDNTTVIITGARIGFYGTPEIVITDPDQMIQPGT